MTPNNSIPFSLNSGKITKDIKAIKNWIDADIKYQIWSLNSNQNTSSTTDKEVKDNTIGSPDKKS